MRFLEVSSSVIILHINCVKLLQKGLILLTLNFSTGRQRRRDRRVETDTYSIGSDVVVDV